MRIVLPGQLLLPDGRLLRVQNAYAIGLHAVCFEEFDRYCVDCGLPLPGDAGWGRGTLPVIHVTWTEAVHYALWLSRQTGRTYRLPSHVEWEYAARAGATTRFPWGSHIEPGDANYLDTPGYGTFPVASLSPNAWGLHQVMGNVAEWVADDVGPGTGMVLGGHWATPAADLDLSRREPIPLGTRSDRVGFRLAADL